MEFPRGYWLYEKSKHLWVSGHPVKSKLFKTPQDFGIHILWLFSSSQDRRDCCCVHCNIPPPGRGAPAVDDVPVAKPRVSEEPSQDKPTAYVKPVPNLSASNVPVSGLNPQAQAQPQPLPGGQLAGSQPALAAASNAPMPQPNAAPTPAPAPVSSLLYRIGELVWYTNGPSWRLGLITQSANGAHQVVPLGHNCFQQPLVAKKDAELRPFQAFTVPPVSIADFKGRTYDEIPWEVVLRNLTADQSRTHRDVILLDASKLAALKIDLSYSLFGMLDQQGGVSLHQGVFLGAERIEVGDTLRVTPNSFHVEGIVYFSLSDIRSSEVSTGRAVSFGGTCYQLHEGVNDQIAPVSDDELPRALREESIWRKSVSPGQPLSFSRLDGYVWLTEAEVRGRFYPTHLLAPIQDPAKFEEAVRTGNRTAVTPALNGRLDSAVVGTKHIGWRPNRTVTTGGAIPHNTVFRFEPQVREDLGGQ